MSFRAEGSVSAEERRGNSGAGNLKERCQKKSAEIIAAISSCLPSGKEKYALHEPAFAGKEWQYTKECLDTGWISSVGKFVDEFEVALRKITGAAAAVAVVNGTAALHIALKLAGVQRDDEVLLPTITFIATANAVTYCGAVPHFVDSTEETLGVDPDKLEAYLEDIVQRESGQSINRLTGRRIKALLVMHTLGHPVDLEKCAALCQRFGIELIEDAAEALGSEYRDRHVGSYGKLSTLSFNGNKVVTTGGGGAILTNDLELGRTAKHITTTAKVPHAWRFYHDEVGYNYRLPNINAAIGLAQLEQLPDFLRRKRVLAERYAQKFRNVD